MYVTLLFLFLGNINLSFSQETKLVALEERDYDLESKGIVWDAIALKGLD